MYANISAYWLYIAMTDSSTVAMHQHTVMYEHDSKRSKRIFLHFRMLQKMAVSHLPKFFNSIT